MKNLFLIFLIILIECCLNFKVINGQCWLKSYARGVGHPISSCNGETEKSGALC